MEQQKNRFINSLFNFLKEEANNLDTTNYVLLKWLGNDLMQLPEGSDLDILIDKKLENKIVHYLESNSDLLKIRQEKRAGVHHYYLYFKNDDFLQIDLLFQLVRKNLVYLPIENIFLQSIEINGIATCSPAIVLEHTLLFNYLNKSGLPKKYIAYFDALPSIEKNKLINDLNSKYGTHFSTIQNLAEFKKEERENIVQY